MMQAEESWLQFDASDMTALQKLFSTEIWGTKTNSTQAWN